MNRTLNVIAFVVFASALFIRSTDPVIPQIAAGLNVDRSNDNMSLYNLCFRNLVDESSSTVAQYIINNYTAMNIGYFDNPSISDIDIFAAHIGMNFYNDTSVGNTHSLYNAKLSNIDFNLVDYAMFTASATTTIVAQLSNISAQGAESVFGGPAINDPLFYLPSDNVKLQISGLSIPTTGGGVLVLGTGTASG